VSSSCTRDYEPLNHT